MPEHFNAYVAHLDAKGTTPKHRKERRRCLERVAKECRLTRLRDMNRAAVERWPAVCKEEGMGARTLNSYRTALLAFANWALCDGRLLTNLLLGIPSANERMDRRHERRAFNDEELVALLDAARRRPLHDRLNRNRGIGRAKLRPVARRKLERLGIERATFYKLMALSGLRRKEVAGLRVGDLVLDGEVPHIILRPEVEKARRGAKIRLRDDMAAGLRGHGST